MNFLEKELDDIENIDGKGDYFQSLSFDKQIEYFQNEVKTSIVHFQYPSFEMQDESHPEYKDSKEMLWNWRKDRSLSSPKVLDKLIASELNKLSNNFNF